MNAGALPPQANPQAMSAFQAMGGGLLAQQAPQPVQQQAGLASPDSLRQFMQMIGSRYLG
jgi:hypothetical protein